MKLESYQDKLDFLTQRIGEINNKVSSFLGTELHLQVVEKTAYNGSKYIAVEDNINRKEQAGIFSKAFKKVTVVSFQLWWGDTKLMFDLTFQYDHVDCGSNGAYFCTVQVTDDTVEVRQREK